MADERAATDGTTEQATPRPPRQALADALSDLGAVGTFAEAIGLQFTEVSADAVTARWQAGPRLHQPYGIVHGGVHCTVVETLGSIASALWFGDRGQVVGVSNQTDFYRAVSAGALVSRATPVHRGRSQQVWVVETRDEQDRLVARGQLRTQNLPTRNPPTPG